MQIPRGEDGSFKFKALNPGVYVYYCATASSGSAPRLDVMNRATILSVLRILVGLLFLIEVVTKLPDWLVSGASLADILNLFVAQSVPLYAGFLSYVALPNASTFARLVVIAELAASFSPDSGRVASGWRGAGRLADAELFADARRAGSPVGDRCDGLCDRLCVNAAGR